MKIQIYASVLLILLLSACARKSIIVSDEFLSGMSPTEIETIEQIEKQIVSIIDDREPIKHQIQITNLKIQITNQQLSRLNLRKKLLADKSAFLKAQGDDFTLTLARQETIKNNTRIELKNLELNVLKAELADQKAQMDVNKITLSTQVARRALEQAKIARTRQDELFGDNSDKADSKYDLSVFEDHLTNEGIRLKEKENHRLGTLNAIQEAESLLSYKQLSISLLEEDPLLLPYRDTRDLEAQTGPTVQDAMKQTRIEVAMIEKEIRLMEKTDTIRIDSLLLYQIINDSLAQKEMRERIQQNKQSLIQRKTVANAVNARLVWERALFEFKARSSDLPPPEPQANLSTPDADSEPAKTPETQAIEDKKSPQLKKRQLEALEKQASFQQATYALEQAIQKMTSAHSDK